MKIDEICPKEKKLVVWGTGNAAKTIFQHYADFERIAFFVSRDFKQNPVFFGKPVYGKELLDKEKHFVVIAATDLFYKEILQELKEQGFSEEKYCVVSHNYICLSSAKYLLFNAQRKIFIPVGKFSGFPSTFFGLCKSIGGFVSVNTTALMGREHIKETTTSWFLEIGKCFSTSNEKLLEAYYVAGVNSVSIGNDVWIGANTFINSNKVKSIGNGAIIGSGAVVTHDVPPYAIMVGCPARVLRYRFSPEEIECLERVKWWDWSNEELEKNADLLYNHELFFKKFMKGD